MYTPPVCTKRFFYSADLKSASFTPFPATLLCILPLCGDSKLPIPWRCQSLTFCLLSYTISVRMLSPFLFNKQTPIHTLIPRNITFLRIPSTFSICAFIVIPDTFYYLSPTSILLVFHSTWRMPLNIHHEKKDRWYLCVKFFLLSILPNLILGINLFRIFSRSCFQDCSHFGLFIFMFNFKKFLVNDLMM